MSLQQIKNDVINCTKCKLSKTRTNAVPGKGSYTADIIFVGEAPGRIEDIRGEPFVGIAGKKLDDALQYAGISRNDTYITNVAKCRPPNNRVPTKEEKQVCSTNYLENEIIIINPKIICVMGNTAFGSLLNGSDIMKHRGKIFAKNKRLYYISLHPAAIIYRQELEQVFKDDIKKLRVIANQLKTGQSVKIDHEESSN